MIKIHDTLTGEKKDFLPLDPQGKKVNMYTCGVTVYDDCHIGHARSLYIFDVIRRYLKYRGYDVTLVRNITDIDDKIINRANELKVNWKELVDKYITKYYQDLDSLGVSRADIEPRATENISEMIVYISGLIEKGFAYATATGVYFSVRKFTEYGKLSGQSIEQMLTGVRKAADDTKEDPLDFALWKLSKPEEPGWPSPWGEGRPGWHIECSVMSQKYLKTDTLDIHAGGRDLVFPHHENEIAQAEALTGKTFAKFWIHHGLLTINAQKMSKSLGNFIKITDVVQSYGANALKVFFLQALYSSPVDFTKEKMEEATKTLQAFEILFFKIEQIKKAHMTDKSHSADFIQQGKNDFIEAMDDDFNTPRAFAAVFNLIHGAHKFIDNNKEDPDYASIANMAQSVILELTSVLGLSLKEAQAIDRGLKEYVEAKIIERNAAGKAKDFKKADMIREELRTKGVILEDTKGWMSKPALEGTTWRLGS